MGTTGTTVVVEVSSGGRRTVVTRRAVVGALALAVTVCLAAGCSSNGGDQVEAATTTSTRPAPTDYRSAMVSRLTDEWGDPATAEQVVAALGPDGLTAWEARVTMAEVATTPLLVYRPATTPADEIGSVVVFAFGNRQAADGTLEPGPVNQELADVTAAFVAEHPVPVFAQWEVARLLRAAGVADVTSIEPTTGPDGKVVYLSTRGVGDAAVADASAAGVPMGIAGVLCFADHLGRCLLTASAAGMDAVAVDGVELPAEYDPQSGQPWTRERVAYLVTDLGGRLLA